MNVWCQLDEIPYVLHRKLSATFEEEGEELEEEEEEEDEERSRKN